MNSRREPHDEAALPAPGAKASFGVVEEHDLDDAQVVVGADHAGKDADHGERPQSPPSRRQEDVNLAKKPASGGMPASENISIASTKATPDWSWRGRASSSRCLRLCRPCGASRARRRRRRASWRRRSPCRSERPGRPRRAGGKADQRKADVADGRVGEQALDVASGRWPRRRRAPWRRSRGRP